LSPEAIWAEDQLEAEASIPKVGGPATIGEYSETVSFEDSQTPLGLLEDPEREREVRERIDGVAEKIRKVIEAHGPTPGGVAVKQHGTKSGYNSGCRMGDECPGAELVGKTCKAAHADYSREKYREKHGLAGWADGSFSVSGELQVAEPAAAIGIFARSGTSVRAEGLLTDLADAREELASVRVLLAERDAELEQARTDFEALDERVREQAREHGRVVADYRRRNEMLMRELEEQDVARLRQQLASSAPVHGRVEMHPPLRPASLKVMPVGGGAMVEYDGAGRVELDFADGELKHAAVSGR
jgi:hypothetical protein